jgi:hypothetical protein
MGATSELAHVFFGTQQRGAPASKPRTGLATGRRSGASAGLETRLDLIDDLCSLYVDATRESHADAHLSGVLPPDYWMNDQLVRLGQQFRVQTVDGYRYEIYDVASSTPA